MRPDELEHRLQERLDALGPAPRHYSTEPELGDTYVSDTPVAMAVFEESDD